MYCPHCRKQNPGADTDQCCIFCGKPLSRVEEPPLVGAAPTPATALRRCRLPLLLPGFLWVVLCCLMAGVYALPFCDTEEVVLNGYELLRRIRIGLPESSLAQKTFFVYPVLALVGLVTGCLLGCRPERLGFRYAIAGVQVADGILLFICAIFSTDAAVKRLTPMDALGTGVTIFRLLAFGMLVAAVISTVWCVKCSCRRAAETE